MHLDPKPHHPHHRGRGGANPKPNTHHLGGLRGGTMVYTRNPREGRHIYLKSANSHRDGPPEPGILVSVVTFEAMQLRGMSKVVTLTWIGHGFGLRRAQLLTLNPKPFHIYTPKP